jgi:peptide/nickel transport system substrate-binding protein
LPSNFLSFNPNIPQYSYDPAKAKQLLAEAGHPNGGFTIKYVYESGYWWKRPLGELFQSNMKDLGISVEIQEMSPSAWAATLSNPDTAGEAFGLVWWPTLATPYDYMWSIFDTQAQGSAGYNWGYYSNPKLDKLLDAASAEPDDAKRKQMYGEAQKLLVEESPALYVYEKYYRLPMSDKLQGFVFNGIYIETIDFYAVHKE